MNSRKFLTSISLAILVHGCGQSSTQSRAERFDQWQSEGSNRQELAAFQKFLKRNDVANTVPLEQLLRSDTNWKKCRSKPYALPPRRLWPNIVPALKLVRDKVEPVVGPVVALSVFRNPEINSCIKGASRSFHLQFGALDLRPVNNLSRSALVAKLCTLHLKNGKDHKLGLGIYRGTRFHIDAAGFRGWGPDYRGATFPCHNVALQRNIG